MEMYYYLYYTSLLNPLHYVYNMENKKSGSTVL